MIRPKATLTEFGFRMLKQQQWKTEDTQDRKSTQNDWRIYEGRRENGVSEKCYKTESPERTSLPEDEKLKWVAELL